MNEVLFVIAAAGWLVAGVSLAGLVAAVQRIAVLDAELTHADDYGALWHRRAKNAEASLRLVLLDQPTEEKNDGQA